MLAIKIRIKNAWERQPLREKIADPAAGREASFLALLVSEAVPDPGTAPYLPPHSPPLPPPPGPGHQPICPEAQADRKQTRGLWEVGDDGECNEVGGGRQGVVVNVVSLGWKVCVGG